MSKKRLTFEYVTLKKYDGMMGRCYRTSDKSYPNYGGRGIKVCGEWAKDIEAFRSWVRRELVRADISMALFIVGSRNYQLDRIDPEDHYLPENCRIASSQVNARNNRKTKGKIIITAEGERIVYGK